MDKILTKMNKLYSKEELQKELKSYEKIFNPTIIAYLKSLLSLKISVIKNYLNGQDFEPLVNLDIYKNIAIYNIYYRLLKILENIHGLEISKEPNLKAYIKLNNDLKEIFCFDFNNYPSVLNNMEEIGTITMHQVLDIPREKSNYKSLYGDENNFKEDISIAMQKIKLSNLSNLPNYQKREIIITNMLYLMFIDEFGLTKGTILKRENPRLKIYKQIDYI